MIEKEKIIQYNSFRIQLDSKNNHSKSYKIFYYPNENFQNNPTSYFELKYQQITVHLYQLENLQLQAKIKNVPMNISCKKLIEYIKSNNNQINDLEGQILLFPQNKFEPAINPMQSNEDLNKYTITMPGGIIKRAILFYYILGKEIDNINTHHAYTIQIFEDGYQLKGKYGICLNPKSRYIDILKRLKAKEPESEKWKISRIIQKEFGEKTYIEIKEIQHSLYDQIIYSSLYDQENTLRFDFLENENSEVKIIYQATLNDTDGQFNNYPFYFTIFSHETVADFKKRLKNQLKDQKLSYIKVFVGYLFSILYGFNSVKNDLLSDNDKIYEKKTKYTEIVLIYDPKESSKFTLGK